MEVKHIHIFIVLSLIALVGIAMNNQYTGRVYYRDYGGYYGGFNFFDFTFFNLSDLYYQYGSIIDAVIFLIIFLGLGMEIFGKKFTGSGGRAIYIGVGLFLTFSLVLWEEANNIRLLELFGPFVLIILLIIIAFIAYKYIKELGVGGFEAVAITYLVFYIIFKNWDTLYGYYINNLSMAIKENLLQLIAWLSGIAIVLSRVHAWWKHSQAKKKGS